MTKKYVEADKGTYGNDYISVNLCKVMCDGLNPIKLYHLLKYNLESNELVNIYSSNNGEPINLGLKMYSDILDFIYRINKTIFLQ